MAMPESIPKSGAKTSTPEHPPLDATRNETGEGPSDPSWFIDPKTVSRANGARDTTGGARDGRRHGRPVDVRGHGPSPPTWRCPRASPKELKPTHPSTPRLTRIDDCRAMLKGANTADYPRSTLPRQLPEQAWAPRTAPAQTPSSSHLPLIIAVKKKRLVTALDTPRG